ncbi:MULTISPECIES: GNAT family N-acetyltransferase [Bacillus]|uniref:GNAT family N-acetyltransferase n=1 Tax=Bacillus TaxID=1386 RepID=UPI00035C1E63|nr:MULTISPECIES: GNAT family N-acetyltransferase [Bacillus]
MNVYKATVNDVEGVSRLFNSYRMFYEKPSDLNGAKRFIKERMDLGDSIIYVAVEEGMYVGFVQLYPSYSSVSMNRIWILNDLYVEEDVRKKGVGQKLIDQAVELCHQTNAKTLTLQTSVTNKTAQKLYEKNDFVKDNEFYYYELTVR